ncbi:MAG: hypothetical protein ACJA0Z_001540 [Halioglobus sp.]|jgi:hypothetical protein
MFAVIFGRARAFAIESMSCNGYPSMVGLGLTSLDSAIENIAIGYPVKFLDGTTGFINLSAGGCHRTTKFNDIVEVEYTRLIIHRRIVTARVNGKLFS